MAAPLFAAAAVLVVLPALMTLGLAFTDYDGLSGPRWSGLANFRRMIGDDLFWTALWNSLVYAAIAVPLRLGVALGTTLKYSRPPRGVRALRAPL